MIREVRECLPQALEVCAPKASRASPRPPPKEPMHPDRESAWTAPADAEEQPRQVRRILKLFRPYRGRLAVVGLLVGAASLVSVATPFLLDRGARRTAGHPDDGHEPSTGTGRGLRTA
ncbi:hypothetical protein SVIOM342S_00359 [Streptomyces violaceorubidus]